MRPDLVIFDCDGVLVDSEPLGVELDRRLFAGWGWELATEEIVHRFLGRSDVYIRAEVEAHLGRTLGPEWEAGFVDAFRELLARELVAVDGVVEALDAIDAAGVPTCVASSGTPDKLRFTLGLTGLWDRFAGRIYSTVEVAHGKPAPDLFLHAAARMGVAPERCVVVEDSRFGARAAGAAGMRCLGYAGGLTPAAWLLEEGAEIVTDLRTLPDHLGLRVIP